MFTLLLPLALADTPSSCVSDIEKLSFASTVASVKA